MPVGLVLVFVSRVLVLASAFARAATLDMVTDTANTANAAKAAIAAEQEQSPTVVKAKPQTLNPKPLNPKP